MELLIVTFECDADAVLPALHDLVDCVCVAEPEFDVLGLDTSPFARWPDVVILDARSHLATARGLCRGLRTRYPRLPLVAVMAEEGLASVSAEWWVDDVLTPLASAAEVSLRLRLLNQTQAAHNDGSLTLGSLTVDETAHTAAVGGRVLALNFRERTRDTRWRATRHHTGYEEAGELSSLVKDHQRPRFAGSRNIHIDHREGQLR